MKLSNVEIAAGYRAARDGGKVAEARKFQTLIISQNQGLVRKLVARFVRPQSDADAEDAMQAGSMGLLRALEDYDSEKSSFSTYAAHWIRDHMQRWAGKTSSVSRPRSASMPASIAKAAALFRGKTGKEPTATDLGVTEAQLTEWSEGSHFVYLDEETSEEYGKFELASDNEEAAHAIDRIGLESLWSEAVSGLSERNVQIAEAVFWSGETVESVAKRFGFSNHCNVVKICQRVEESLKRAVARSNGPPSSRRHELVKKHLERVQKFRAAKGEGHGNG